MRHLLHRLSAIVFAATTVTVPLLNGISDAYAEQERFPNIILCMADDQGWGDVAYNGHKVLQTPVLDEMAAKGLRFDRFYAAAPVCSPTRGSVLTGRHPNRFGCFSWGRTLRPQEITIAEALKQAGYTTGHFGKWHVGSVRADSPVCPGNSGFDVWYSSPNFYENSPILSHNGKAVETQGESSMVTVELAVPFMKKARDDKKPFLAVIWFGNPHTPNVATPELQALYEGQSKKLANLYGEITGIDRAMGRLRTELRSMGIADNTIVWYTSDNGAIPGGSTGGLRARKGSIYEGGLRVPAVIEWPAKIKRPRRTSVNAGTVDIYPTLIDIVGLDVPGQVKPLDGVSLVPLINGRMKSRDKPMGFWKHKIGGISTPAARLMKQLLEEQEAGQQTPAKDLNAADVSKQYDENDLPGHSAWLDGDYKLHRIVGRGGKVTWELYHLGNDPSEKNDLLEAEPMRVEKMKAELLAWQRSVVRSLNGDDYK